MTLYFAYGANMDPLHMAEHCPGAVRLDSARLPEHRFGIAAGGFGVVRRSPGSAVHGVLWRLTSADEAALDVFEDVAGAFYRKDSATVHTAGSVTVQAMIYQPVDDRPGVPAPGYLERIIEVATLLGFPPAYLEHLDAARSRPPA